MFAKPEIGKFEVASVIDEYIVGFDVPMNVVHFVHILNCQNELADI